MKFTTSILLLLVTGTATAFAPTLTTDETRGVSGRSALWAKPKVFIDGEAGTTGIQVYGRLDKRNDLEIISPPADLRKDPETRKKFINDADAVILCTFIVFACFFFQHRLLFYFLVSKRYQKYIKKKLTINFFRYLD